MQFSTTFLLAQADNGGGGSLFGGMFGSLIMLAIIIGVIAGWWKLFEKAGKPGWAAIVPIYNAVVLLEIAGRPIWWIILFIIPCFNIIAALIVSIDVAKAFGKDTVYGLLLFFFGFIFYPVLGFSDAKYIGPQAKSI